ncbi:MAG: DNA ligase D [Casimicrobiaceae bacterium]
MALDKYRQKRDFTVTTEPKGALKKAAGGPLSFVIQKHAASHLHYDFRLELDGVLLSWAVPKGPSLDPNDKRLAMHVEDHPMEYGEFEGVIPAKQYGAGTVMLWDRGTWLPKSDPREAYQKGRLKFDLVGEKLHGGWNLVRTRSAKYGADKAWLLFKEADDYARLGSDALIGDDRPESVATGRSLEEIATEPKRVWHSNKSVTANVEAGAVAKAKPLTGVGKLKGAHKAPLPAFVGAQLATLSKTPPVGEQWIHEIKYDGYRMLCRVSDGEARMVSRTRKDWSSDFQSIARAVARLPLKTAWLDGEVVAMDANGRSSFQALQTALSESTTSGLVYLVFDLLYLDGFDLRKVPLEVRKQTLKTLLSEADGSLRYSDHFSAPGPQFLENVCRLGLEGMVSKRASAAHFDGRSAGWLKTKCIRRQEMVIGGFTRPGGSRVGFGALLLGVHDEKGKLLYSGRVGTGFDDKLLTSLHKTLVGLEQPNTPFCNPPTGADARGVHWVRPALVAEVSFTEWTADGTLRHPVFQGLRQDKKSKDVYRERERAAEPVPAGTAVASAAAKVRSKSPVPNVDPGAIAGVSLSNPDKILYPEAKFTKRDLALYYERIAPWLLPHLEDRPLTLMRCPNGWEKSCFYQKNADASVVSSIDRVAITNSDGSQSQYMMANSLTAVVALVQMGTLELHPWGSRAAHLERPDQLTFDLDPDDAVAWEDVKQAALLVQTLLENIGLQAFLKTTGGKGLHVVTPIEPSVAWADAKGFTKAVAEFLERTFPDRFTSKLLKVSRHGKIFIDYLRNAEGATAVAAYSTRARAHCPVSTPVAWRELSRDIRFAHFNIVNVSKRLAKLKEDPWTGFAEAARPIDKSVMAQVGYMPAK